VVPAHKVELENELLHVFSCIGIYIDSSYAVLKIYLMNLTMSIVSKIGTITRKIQDVDIASILVSMIILILQAAKNSNFLIGKQNEVKPIQVLHEQQSGVPGLQGF